MRWIRKSQERLVRRWFLRFIRPFHSLSSNIESLSEAKKQIAMIRERKIDSDQLSSSASIERELMWLLWAEKSRYEVEKLLADITAAVVLAHEEKVRISHELGESLQ